MDTKIYEPLPPPTVKEALTRPELTAEQVKMQEKIQAHFTKPGYTLPAIESSGELMEEEKFWLSFECQLRYLRATKFKRLESTLQMEKRVRRFSSGTDVYGRPGFYMIPSRQNTTEATRQIEFAVWMLERCIDLMDEGVESLDLLINFADKAKNPSMSTSRTVLSILQNHYPERLGKALVINVPYLKLAFNPSVVKDKIFTEDQVMKDFWGGTRTLSMTTQTKWMENWKTLGGTIGIHESAYKVDHELVDAA
ncbi:hypothetical protein BT96DRAFT_960822 [Gymnopus androsaceus JB14]|uniref:CRAL-TRIO domain-containing protein n=1 Tax=Gymnopus androsaceus JB14 TaxID=1447944 RepID=A0A6A4GHN8_9AGAR|nr:hypothetical protein BT96DRAFT_960822 [Gymnopus androsaceus JB14]